MASVELRLSHHRYQVRIEPGLLGKLGQLVKEVAPHQRAALFADEVVFREHGERAVASLKAAGYSVTTQPIPGGEERKNLDAIRAMYDVLVTNRFERKSPVIALGGGVVGDSVGFASATYLRGTPFIQCPTTLLAMVDASVGGKVGVNLPQGKNLVGAFHQPHLVCIDTDTLATLPPRELRCGLAECVKHGVIRDPALFEWIEKYVGEILHLDPAVLVELVQRNVAIKAAVVMADERETAPSGDRAHLNFGHTFAHAIEALAGYGHYHHGEAVSLGMVAATRLAAAAGRCPASLVPRLVKLLDAIGLPTHADDLPPTADLMQAMRLDKKVASGKIRLVLPDRLGAVSITDATPDHAIHDAWESLRRKASA